MLCSIFVNYHLKGEQTLSWRQSNTSWQEGKSFSFSWHGSLYYCCLLLYLNTSIITQRVNVTWCQTISLLNTAVEIKQLFARWPSFFLWLKTHQQNKQGKAIIQLYDTSSQRKQQLNFSFLWKHSIGQWKIIKTTKYCQGRFIHSWYAPIELFGRILEINFQ